MIKEGFEYYARSSDLTEVVQDDTDDTWDPDDREWVATNGDGIAEDSDTALPPDREPIPGEEQIMADRAVELEAIPASAQEIGRSLREQG